MKKRFNLHRNCWCGLENDCKGPGLEISDAKRNRFTLKFLFDYDESSNKLPSMGLSCYRLGCPTKLVLDKILEIYRIASFQVIK